MKKSCLIILMAAVLFSGCKAKEIFDGTAENEILTFINNEEDKKKLIEMVEEKLKEIRK